jgi:hypothetical protein
MTSRSGASELKALLQLLNDSVNTILTSPDSDTIPSLSDPNPAPPAMTVATATACAAAAQLQATLQGPAFVLGKALEVSVLGTTGPAVRF